MAEMLCPLAPPFAVSFPPLSAKKLQLHVLRVVENLSECHLPAFTLIWQKECVVIILRLLINASRGEEKRFDIFVNPNP